MQQYERSLNDPRLLSLRDEIAASDAKIVALLEALRSLPGGKQSETSGSALRKEIRAAKNAVAKGLSGAEFAAILTQLETMIAYSGETGHRIRSKPAGSERSDAGG